MPRNGVPGIKSPDPRGSGHSDKPKKPAGLFRPAAAQGFIKVDQSQVLVAHGIADPDLSVEITALCIQHVDIIDAPARKVSASRVLDLAHRRRLASILARRTGAWNGLIR